MSQPVAAMIVVRYACSPSQQPQAAYALSPGQWGSRAAPPTAPTTPAPALPRLLGSSGRAAQKEANSKPPHRNEDETQEALNYTVPRDVSSLSEDCGDLPFRRAISWRSEASTVAPEQTSPQPCCGSLPFGREISWRSEASTVALDQTSTKPRCGYLPFGREISARSEASTVALDQTSTKPRCGSLPFGREISGRSEASTVAPEQTSPQPPKPRCGSLPFGRETSWRSEANTVAHEQTSPQRRCVTLPFQRDVSLRSEGVSTEAPETPCRRSPAGSVEVEEQQETPTAYSVKHTFVHMEEEEPFITLPPRSASVPHFFAPTSWSDDELPSIGSAAHARGECKPCAWFWKGQGCHNGRECRHCHLCPAGEIQRRRRLKKESSRDREIKQITCEVEKDV